MKVSGAEKMHRLCGRKSKIWMGIINATPDSFSDGGRYVSPGAAAQRARELVENGADILDIGGVSTRPGSQPIGVAEEWDRLFPVVTAVREVILDRAVVSVDTSSPAVAFRLADKGLIDVINDVWAGRKIEDINPFGEESPYPGDELSLSTFDVARTFGLGLVLMHMRGTPQDMQLAPTYEDCVVEVAQFLSQRADAARCAGVEFVAVDPGIGFGKRLEDNLALLSKAGIQALASTGFPVLIGLSRKSFLEKLGETGTSTLGASPTQRDAASKRWEFQSFGNGAQIIRTHVMPNEVS